MYLKNAEREGNQRMEKYSIFQRLAKAGIYERHVRSLYCLGWEKVLKEVDGLHEKSIVLLGQNYIDCVNWEHQRYRWLYDLSLTILEERLTLWSLLRERGEQRVRLLELFRVSLNEGLVGMLEEVNQDLPKACHITRRDAMFLTAWKRDRATVAEQALEVGVTISKVPKVRRRILDEMRRNLRDNYLIRTTMIALPPYYGDAAYDWGYEYWQ